MNKAKARARHAWWNAEWGRRQAAVRVALGNPLWIARSRIALSMPPAPPNPDARVSLDLTRLSAGESFTFDGNQISVGTRRK
jgi:hypothetical protein